MKKTLGTVDCFQETREGCSEDTGQKLTISAPSMEEIDNSTQDSHRTNQKRGAEHQNSETNATVCSRTVKDFLLGISASTWNPGTQNSKTKASLSYTESPVTTVKFD